MCRDFFGVKVLEMRIVLSLEEISFFGVKDNFIATLEGVFTGVLK